MQVIKSFFVGILLLTPFLKTYASSLKDSASVGINTYSDSSDVTVYSPTFSLMKTLSKNLLVGFSMRIDAITAASITNGGSPVIADTVVGASAKEGFDEMRYAPTFLMAYEDGENAVSGGFYLSTENDYDGKAIFLNYLRQLNEENTAVGIGISQSDDTWSPVTHRVLVPNNSRKEGKIDISVNQLISPTASIQFVYSKLWSEGFLSSTYHYVLQDGFAKFEKYPSTRSGDAFAVKGVNLLSDENSINYAYRYYTDDWDISSHTLNVEWMHEFNSKLTSGIRVRYYTQSKANFSKELGTYSATDPYFAIDYRTSAFDSYDLGIPFIYKPSPTSQYKFTASVDLYQTSNNANIKSWHGDSNIQAIYTTLKVDYEF